MGSCAGICSGSKRASSNLPPTLPSAASTLNKSIIVNPSQFVRETTEDFKENYEIGKKLGGGILFP
jgi:hypothetical protein